MALIPCPECKKRISDTSDRCPKCGFQLTPEIIEDIKKKEAKTKKGCTIGCLGVIILIFIIYVIGDLTRSCGVIIESDTAKGNETLFSTYDLDTAAFTVATTVYDIAKKYKKVKEIKVSVYMSALGLQDKYGNEITGKLYMGDIIINNANEVRKYRTLASYTQNAATKRMFRTQIATMNHAYLLK